MFVSDTPHKMLRKHIQKAKTAFLCTNAYYFSTLSTIPPSARWQECGKLVIYQLYFIGYNEEK